MKARNVIVSLFLALFLVAAGGAWWLFMSIDGLVKQAIERWGPEITGVTVKVDSVSIRAAEGSGVIRGLYVGNPKGFDAKHALTLGEMRLTIDTASITKDVVVIKELTLVAPSVVYERGQGSDNLTVIQKRVDAWVAQNAGAKKEGPGRKFVIEKVTIKDGKAHFGTTVSLPMPDLHLRDVGRNTNGATAGEVVKQVWGAIQHSISILALRVGSKIKEGASDAIDGVKKLFK